MTICLAMHQPEYAAWLGVCRRVFVGTWLFCYVFGWLNFIGEAVRVCENF